MKFIETENLGPKDPWIVLWGAAASATPFIADSLGSDKVRILLPSALRTMAQEIVGLELRVNHVSQPIGHVQAAHFREVNGVPAVWVKAMIPRKWSGQFVKPVGAINEFIAGCHKLGFSVGGTGVSPKKHDQVTQEDLRFIRNDFRENVPGLLEELKTKGRRDLSQHWKDFRAQLTFAHRVKLGELSIGPDPANPDCIIKREHITFYIPKRKEKKSHEKVAQVCDGVVWIS